MASAALCATSTVLTGQDGLVMFKPAGTQHCLLDLTDFPAGAGVVTVPLQHDFKPGDPIQFNEEGGNLDSALAANTTYYVGLVTDRSIQVLPTRGGAPMTLNGDGGVSGSTKGPIKTLGIVTPGTGYTQGTFLNVTAVGGTGTGATLDIVVSVSGAVQTVTLRNPGQGYTATDLLSGLVGGMGGGSGWKVPVSAIHDSFDSPGGHIGVRYADYAAVCQVKSFDFNMTRDKIETTSLPCKVAGNASKYASFKTYQPGFADGTGSMVVQFTHDQESLTSRLLANSMLRSQAGAWVKLYVNAVAGTGSSEVPDDFQSTFIEAPVSLEGFAVTADSTGTNPTQATLNFSISGLPSHILNVAL
jgi:hypothetical protein